MKLAVSMYSYNSLVQKGEMNLPSFIEEAKKAGAEGVELLDFYYKDVTADRATAKAALEATGLPVPIFSTAQNFAKTDPDLRKKALDSILFGLEEAKFYGSSVVRVFSGDVAEGITFDQAREWIVEGLTAASKAAAAAGLKLGLENHGTLAGRGEQVRGIIEDVRRESGNDALGANPDTGNFLLVNQPSDVAIAEVAQYAYMVHFKDFKKKPEGYTDFAYTALDGQEFVGTAVGEGDVKLGACLQLLKDAGYLDWLSVEYEGAETPLQAVPRSIAAAREFI